MGRGILSGLIWGSLISIVVFGTVSQLAPLAPPESEEAAAMPDEQGAGTPPSVAEGAEQTGAEADTTGAADPVQSQATSQLMEKPETDSLPEPASGPEQTAGETEGLATGVDVPAGSEFRRGLPETEAALPSIASAPKTAASPAVPAPGAVDDGAGLTLEAAPRPDAPGMSVTPPTAPDAVEQIVDAPAATPGTDSGADLATEPALPEATAEENAPDARLAQGFPPPIRPETVDVTDAAVPGKAPDRVAARDAMASETPAVEDSASGNGSAVEVEALAPSDPARLADSSGAMAADRAVGTPSSPASGADIVAAAIPAQAPQVAAATPGTAMPAAPGEAVEGVSSDLPSAVAIAPSERPPEVSSVAPRAPMAGADLVPATTSPAATEAEDAEPVDDLEVAAIAPEGTTPDATPEAAMEASPETGPGAGVSQRVGSLTERRGAGSRLPQINAAPSSDDSSDAAVAGAATETAPASSERPAMGALERNARPFDNPDGKPLFSVILIEDGQSGIDLSVLSSFSFPVSFAIDPTRPGAEDVAAELAAAGFEIVALGAGLPENARPSDIETTFGAHLARLPRAVAVMDLPEGGIAGQRALVEQAVTMAAQDGHGLIGWRRGLNPLETAVRRGGTPVALIYRSLDDEGEGSATIKRYLDRAAFKAAQDGSVVMVGRNRPETVAALFEWALGNKASQVAMAPISAILRQQ